MLKIRYGAQLPYSAAMHNEDGNGRRASIVEYFSEIVIMLVHFVAWNQPL